MYFYAYIKRNVWLVGWLVNCVFRLVLSDFHLFFLMIFPFIISTILKSDFPHPFQQLGPEENNHHAPWLQLAVPDASLQQNPATAWRSPDTPLLPSTLEKYFTSLCKPPTILPPATPLHSLLRKKEESKENFQYALWLSCLPPCLWTSSLALRWLPPGVLFPTKS